MEGDRKTKKTLSIFNKSKKKNLIEMEATFVDWNRKENKELMMEI